MGSKISFNRRCKPGTLWRRRSGDRLIACVLRYDEVVVTFTAPWSRTGVLNKAWDSFDAHYRLIQRTPA